VAVPPRTHARDLTPTVVEALGRAGRSWRDLEGVVVGDGPGSFTGLRIAWGTVKGLVSGAPGLVVRTVPSLMAAAASRAADGGTICALYDAMRGEVFAAVYEFGDDVRTVLAPTLTSVAHLARESAAPDAVVTDGRVEQTAELRAWSGRAPVVADQGRASALLDLVSRDAATVVIDPHTFQPSYGRKAEAQVRWEERHGRTLPDS
jgi:tRNA threonylcarbamoyladenosine biosynthesis protein TsaB